MRPMFPSLNALYTHVYKRTFLQDGLQSGHKVAFHMPEIYHLSMIFFSQTFSNTKCLLNREPIFFRLILDLFLFSFCNCEYFFSFLFCFHLVVWKAILTGQCSRCKLRTRTFVGSAITFSCRMKLLHTKSACLSLSVSHFLSRSRIPKASQRSFA